MFTETTMIDFEALFVQLREVMVDEVCGAEGVVDCVVKSWQGVAEQAFYREIVLAVLIAFPHHRRPVLRVAPSLALPLLFRLVAARAAEWRAAVAS